MRVSSTDLRFGVHAVGRCVLSRSGALYLGGVLLRGEPAHLPQVIRLGVALFGGGRGAFGVELGCFLPSRQARCRQWGGGFHEGGYLSHGSGFLPEISASVCMLSGVECPVDQERLVVAMAVGVTERWRLAVDGGSATS